MIAEDLDGNTNETILGSITITPNWDVDCNGVVDILDLSIVSYYYGASEFPMRADVDRNGVVDILDLSIVSYYYGETYS
jgi:hypothetical protein